MIHLVVNLTTPFYTVTHYKDSYTHTPLPQSPTFPGLYELVALSSSVSIELRTPDFDWLAPAPYQGKSISYPTWLALKFQDLLFGVHG